ncbi:hypothetical protein DFH08DRAFT_809820 [Mycena albidolilacea]|uniref:Uncharacterized protein n=1 Tax=Mycena albidolilacea TaxID=1033008 RepID=A0AAD7ER60_9AGAR|nr:hypothetical protein DFH08DRAFT_809820 [Mycena albidolilacea]
MALAACSSSFLVKYIRPNYRHPLLSRTPDLSNYSKHGSCAHPLTVFLQSEDEVRVGMLLNWLALDAEGNSNDSWSTEAIIIRDAQSLLSLRVSHIPHLKLASPANQLTALDFRPFPDATLALSVLEWSPNVVDFRGINRRRDHVAIYDLERLEISELGDAEAAIEGLGSLVSRLSCDLQYLSTSFQGAMLSQIRRFLQVGNSIRYLKLLNVWFYHQLEVLEDPGDLLPRLERLEIDGTLG